MKSHQLIGDTREIFFFKNHAEDEAGRLVPDLFLFFKKALYEIKASCLQFRISIAPNWHIIKKTLSSFRLLIQRYVQFWFFRKGSGNSFSTTFWEWFLKKNGPHVITKFYCLIPFTSWDIGQDVYCNYLLTRLWRHKFLDWPDLFNQAVFIHNQRVKTKT